MLKIKRAYEKKETNDGPGLLVDRLWPRGLSSAQAGVDQWLKDLSPSDELRRWFAHKVERWSEFRERYMAELSTPEKRELLERVARLAINGNITLLYAARDEEHHNARVLAELVSRLMMSLPQT